MSKRKIAISGTIGSGKSTVLNYLKSKGYFVFSCDEYNAFLLNKGQEGYIQIQEQFPEAFIKGELDKKALSKIVFNNPLQRERLESIMHPLIIAEMLRLRDLYEIYFAEVPLLFENNLEKYFDLSLLIVTDEQKALERLQKRGLDHDDAKQRILNQMPQEIKMKRADEIIYNNGSLADLYNQVDTVINKYVR
ncbi:MAG: dephospho-CoA kinase [Erysipelotrichaceae bacterium]|nr:dephospho-CoA kinase [Erysipelotrichaceae bacterium]